MNNKDYVVEIDNSDADSIIAKLNDKTRMVCPFCGGEVSIMGCDEEGNIHDSSYESDPWSGHVYAIRHDISQARHDCPIATHLGEITGRYIYSSREEAIKSWNMRNGI